MTSDTAAPPKQKHGDDDVLDWVAHRIEVRNAELDIWRERFPLIASGVRQEAEERVTENSRAK
jgi:hypothetical protein